MSGPSRVLAILDLFTHAQPTWSADEINKTSSYSRPTGYRYVKELVAAGLLQRAGAGKFSLGPRVIRLDYEIRQSDPMLLASMGVMAELAAKTELTAVLSAMYGHQIIDIHHAPATADTPPFAYARGKPRPLFRGAAPKVILPLLPRATLIRFYRAFATEIEANGMGRSWLEFRKYLSRIRKDGFYISVGELEPDIVGCGVAIINAENDVVAALALAGSANDVDKVGISAIRELLGQAAAHISCRLA